MKIRRLKRLASKKVWYVARFRVTLSLTETRPIAFTEHLRRWMELVRKVPV